MEQLARITMESGGERLEKAVREANELDSAISRVKKWFKGRRILLLIDDVWRNAEVGSCAVTRLQEIADTEKGGCMAFTAREWGLVDGSEEIEFSLKEEASSLEILLKSAAIRREDMEGLENEVKTILRFCGGLPLALSVVGKAIKTSREVANELDLKNILGEYLEELQDSPSDVFD